MNQSLLIIQENVGAARSYSFSREIILVLTVSAPEDRQDPLTNSCPNCPSHYTITLTITTTPHQYTTINPMSHPLQLPCTLPPQARTASSIQPHTTMLTLPHTSTTTTNSHHHDPLHPMALWVPPSPLMSSASPTLRTSWDTGSWECNLVHKNNCSWMQCLEYHMVH